MIDWIADCRGLLPEGWAALKKEVTLCQRKSLEEGCKTPAESLRNRNRLLIRQVMAQTSKTLKVINQESQI